MSLPAVECMRRGVDNFRANWELALCQAAGACAVVLLILLGFMPILVALGLASVTVLRGVQDWAGWAADVGHRLLEFSLPLLLGCLGALAIWTLALFVMCWFQAGVYGVLMAGERQAPAGAVGDWRLFRTFSGQNFAGWGGRYMGRFFWLINLYLALFLSVFLLFALLLVGAALGGERWGMPAGFAIGCGGALPVVFLVLVLVLWAALAQADMAREDSGVLTASRRALGVLGARLGAVLLIFLFVFLCKLVLGMAFMPFSFASGLLFRDSLAAQLLARGILTLVEGAVGGVIGIVFAGALVALMRSEGPEDRPPDAVGAADVVVAGQ